MRSGPREGIVWTRETIVYAIDLWHRRHLRAPTVSDWAKAGPDHPSYPTVMRRFGSWNAGIRAAGLKPRPPGHPVGPLRVAS